MYSQKISRLHPLIRWAQRKDRVFLEVPLMDITEEKVDLTNTHLKFHCTSGGKKYQFELETFEQVNTETSKWNKTGFHLLFVLEKKNTDAAFWPRLIKSTAKSQYIQVDWSKWVDEDEEEEDPNKGLGGFDPSQMQGFPGMGGMGGMMPGMGGMGGYGDEDDE